MNIVSFYAPRPEHPFFQDYGPYLDLLAESCERYGHRHVCLTDDPSVRDAYVVTLPRPLMRAFIAAQYAYLSDPANANTPTLLTGADCVLANDPEWMRPESREHLQFVGRPDIIITTDDRFLDCRMNMGAMWIPRPAAVAHVWAEALATMDEEWGDDQRAVYAALRRSGLKIAELPCDPYNLAPETPDDDCRRGVVLHFRGPRKRWMTDYCHRWLGIGDGVQLKLAPNTDAPALIENVRANLAKKLRHLEASDGHDRVMVIVGSGPSAEGDIGIIRDMAEYGAVIVGLNGAVRWLEDNGITPDIGVMLDARPDNSRFVVGTAPRAGWLMASHCDPAVVDAAESVTLFHYAQAELAPHLPDGAMMVGGGPTVGLTALTLGFALGFRHFHLFGYDSSSLEGRTHLVSQPATTTESLPMEVFCAGRQFHTTPAMYAQAKAFPDVCALLMEAGAETIAVHGDGLLPHIAHTMTTNAAKAA